MSGVDEIAVRVPGRINLIGDHTDYTGGLVLPMIVDRHTTIRGRFTSDKWWHLESATHGTASFSLPVRDLASLEPMWIRYCAAVVAAVESLGITVPGFTGTVTSTLPIGAGLSSSASLEIATARIALAHVAAMDDVQLALMCQRAELDASGVPCGIMDQLSIVSGKEGHATLIDCHSLDVTRIPIPDDIQFEDRFVMPRTLAGSEYAERVEQCAAIETIIGPLRSASPTDVDSLETEVLRRRARHVISENARVVAFVESLRTRDFELAGRLMTESHWSLSRDFETSNDTMDRAVSDVLATPGVLGARMTGGGFGGCLVVLRHRRSQ